MKLKIAFEINEEKKGGKMGRYRGQRKNLRLKNDALTQAILLSIV